MSKEPTQQEIDAFERMLRVYYAKLGIAISYIANESGLLDAAVLGGIQMVYGDMLAQITNDPGIKQKWIDHCEEFQRRNFLA
jgi:hypothetical protein